MSHSFGFYLYSQNDNKHFVFWNDNDAIISRIASMVDLVPKIVGGNVTALLQKNDELMNVLHRLFDEFLGAYPRLKRIFAYLDKLGQDEEFFYVSSDAPLINHLTCIAQLRCIDDSNERKEVHDYILATWGFVSVKYESYGFGFNGIRKCIGVAKDRVCRFCGKQEGQVTFHKIAHAIPEALGNKLLYCNEECDDCNENLATVEDNLIAYLDINRALYNVKGKGGNKEVEGENFVIRHNNGKISIYLKSDYNEKPDNPSSITLRHRKAMNDQGLYRSLAKIAVDLMPTEKLCHFKETIRWINGLSTGHVMPKVLFGYSHPVLQPSYFLFFNDKDRNAPYCSCVLIICNVIFIYMIPYADVDSNLNMTDDALLMHWKQFTNIFPSVSFKLVDFSEEKIKYPFLTLDTSGIQPNPEREKECPDYGDIFKIHHRSDYSHSYCEFPELPKQLLSAFPLFTLHKLRFKNESLFKPTMHTMLSWISGANFRIYPYKREIDVDVSVTLKDANQKIEFLDTYYTCAFRLSDFFRNIEIDDAFSFDSHLRNKLWNCSLVLGEVNISSELNKTVFRDLKLTTLVSNEECCPYITYFVIDAHGNILLTCNDSKIHRRVGMKKKLDY